MIPFVILAISFIAFLIWLSIAMNFRQSKVAEGRRPGGFPNDNAALNQYFTWQTQVLADQHADLQASKEKLEAYLKSNLPNLDEKVTHSKKIQTDLEKLAVDLLELAKTDPDAKALVTRYNIQQGTPPQPQ